MEEAPLASKQEAPPVPEHKEPSFEDVIARYEEQLNQLADTVSELRRRLDRLAQIGLDVAAEPKMKDMIAGVSRRIEILRDYVAASRAQYEIETGRLEDAKRRLDKLSAKYGHVTENSLEPIVIILVNKIRRLQQLYYTKLIEENSKLNSELQRLEEEVNRLAGKILASLK